MKFCSAILFFLNLVINNPLCANGQYQKATHKINVSIPEVALLKLIDEEPDRSHFNVFPPGEAGDPIQLSKFQSGKGIWINYTSIINDINHRRKVVAMVQDEIPSGLRLLVEASEASGTGRGMLGRTAGPVVLSGEPTEVISDIGSCFTGQGIENGHHLTYSIETDETDGTCAILAQQEIVVNVIYTLTDYN